jgi:hypothetical protein
MQWLDANVKHERRRKIITLLMDVAKASNELPSSLFVAGVQIYSPHPTMSGGFADVFKGEFAGQSIALKRLRMNVRGLERNDVHRVS